MKRDDGCDRRGQPMSRDMNEEREHVSEMTD